MHINRNTLLVSLGDSNKCQDAAVKLLQHDFRVADDPILPIEVLTNQDRKKVTIKLYRNKFVEENDIFIKDLISSLDKGKEPISFVLEALYASLSHIGSPLNIVSQTNSYNIIRKLCDDSVLTQIIQQFPLLTYHTENTI